MINLNNYPFGLRLKMKNLIRDYEEKEEKASRPSHINTNKKNNNNNEQ